MTRSKKIWLGIASVWPLIYVFLFMFTMFGFIFFLAPGNDPAEPLAPMFGVGMLAIFAFHFLTIMFSLALTIYFIIHVVKNESLKPDMKAMWIILFFFFGMIAEPVYWYLQIWKESETSAPSQLNAHATPVWDGSTVRSDYESRTEPPDWR